MKLHIKKGDTVYVLSGEDKGQQGRVLEVQAAKQRAIVEGVNIVTKATKPSAKHPQGGLLGYDGFDFDFHFRFLQGFTGC